MHMDIPPVFLCVHGRKDNTCGDSELVCGIGAERLPVSRIFLPAVD